MDWQWIIEELKAGLAQMTWLEGVAVFFGISSVFYSIKKKILVFPTGMISTLIYVYICLKFKLYADMGINAYYFGMSIYGWYLWSRPQNGKEELKVTWLDKGGIIRSVLLLLGSYLLLYLVLANFTDSDVPYWDSFTTSTAFVGMWLMAKKKVENWIAWIITDIASVPLYLYKGLLLTSFQFLFFTVLAIIGLVSWIKATKTDGETT
ncbi:nicotinamide mononucleotide transporter [Rhodonellum psychrophilum GCM71 = DSM 17998]|uniref:Nicotinamide riboside transporter PnuC n=2 Tax=Rhodonellum TaxID=336827 RepID=U5C6D5_9BACT|nr:MULTISPECIES: nicotinamide riboside transporter PnuC [Rhodonellum]ERM83767.1 nicotinamide mononucleotide transporter [Rhodonellum psychrophilum GCM71 = DSM 17998]SDY64711.1 nicotinamide mononucleotide transporter [Rhodonellum ikkaensis]